MDRLNLLRIVRKGEFRGSLDGFIRSERGADLLQTKASHTRFESWEALAEKHFPPKVVLGSDCQASQGGHGKLAILKGPVGEVFRQ